METKVTCLICGHTAETLARHLKAAHGVSADVYRGQYPGARIRSEACEANRKAAIAQAHVANPRTGLKKTATCPCGAEHEVGHTASLRATCPSCKEREKVEAQALRASQPRAPSPLKGRALSPETRAKMSANAGRWNKGHTKETHPSVARVAEARTGQPSWSKGLTKADHPGLRSTSEKLSAQKTGVPSPKALNLGDVDFTPYLDATGAVDRALMAEELGITEETVTKYMTRLGLRLTNRYVKARAERTTIRLAKETLLPFALANGKIAIGRAMAGLGHDFAVIKRECERHGLPTFHRFISQTLCLEAVSQVLGGATYEMEWRSRAFMTPTGNFYRFDGFFAALGLLVEFHGHQHWEFPSVYIKDRALFDAQVARDREKERQVREDGRYRYLVLREDEPYTDPEYLRQRLLDEGVV